MQQSNDTTAVNESTASGDEVPAIGAAPDSQPGAGQAGSKDADAQFKEALKTAESAAQEHHDAWLRAKAETENVRKRAQVEVASAHNAEPAVKTTSAMM